MNGAQLKQIQTELGLSPEEVCAEAGLSLNTLNKVYRDAKVKETTYNKVKWALSKLFSSTKKR